MEVNCGNSTLNGFSAAIAVIACIAVFYFALLYTMRLLAPGIMRREKARTRKAAREHGFLIEDVERELPDYDSKLKSWSLKKTPCARYTLDWSVPGIATWALLCRPGVKSEGFIDEGWVLDVKSGEVKPELRKLIAQIADDWGMSDDMVEIETKDGKLYFYWYEYGGRSMVEYLDKNFKLLTKEMAS